MTYSELERQLIGDRILKRRQQDKDDRLHEAFKELPQNQIINCVLSVHNNIIPKVIAARGKDHADVKLFEDIRDCLMYALHAVDKAQELGVNFYNLKILNETLFQRCRLLEKELDKYEAVEEMVMHETLDDYKTIAKARLMNLLKVKHDPNI